MSTLQVWWMEEAPKFLSDVLSHINQSRYREELVDRCENLCKALNKTWNAYYAYRKRNNLLTDGEKKNGRTDSQAFAQLLLIGLDDELAERFCGSGSVRCLAEFSPPVMNHDTLMMRNYDPSNLTDELRNEASDEHKQLHNAYKRYVISPSQKDARIALLKKLKQLLYVIRSNIAHSEKTPRGPDTSKNERDRAVSSVTSTVIEDLFDILFDQPSQRLAVYGTLAPGEPNASVLEDIQGEWRDGLVRGELAENMGLRYFRWREPRQEIAVKMLMSKDLPNHLPKIDKFEGNAYKRLLVPVMCGSELYVANIYEGSPTAIRA
jgi:gamma-glutamylcyclotransferase (GGCT)/AIG2-like uncharacterized protein YtfP